MKQTSNVLVVGGGPAGATAARLLAQHGLETIMLEKNLSFRKPCGGGVPTSIFDELGIPKEKNTRTVHHIKIISPRGEEVVLPLTDVQLAFIERGEFDRELRRLASEQNAHIIEGECVGVVPGRKCVTVHAKINGSCASITAEYVIAADGVTSTVRQLLGLKPQRWLYTASEHIKARHANQCEFWFGSSHAPGFYSWVFPVRGGISMGTGCLNPKLLIQYFRTFKKRTGITKNGSRRIYRIPLWEGRLYNRGNILFIGDSAGQVLPLTYEGIYYAMKAGEFAATAICDRKAGNYKKMWKARFQKRFLLMNNLRKYFLKDDLSTERLVAIHKRSEIWEASMGLWLCKDAKMKTLTQYMKFFRKFLH